MRCPRPVRKKRLLCIACTALIIFTVYAGTRIRNEIEFEPSCEELKAYQMIDQLCHDYKAGITGGNLCHDLCVSQTMVLPKCIAHKNTTIIFLGQWKDQDIVFKTKKEPHTYDTLQSMLAEETDNIETTSKKKSPQEQFKEIVYEHIKNEISYPPFKHMFTPDEVLRLMWAPHNIENMTIPDMEGMWLLLQRDEFLKFQLLKNLTHIPKVFGFCGRFYAVEQAKPLDKFAFRPFKVMATWKKRARLALQLLDLQVEFSQSRFGQLHHCDIQAPNFGLTSDERLIALDVDTVFTTPQLKDFLEQPSCTKDEDCDFFDCVSACNQTAGQCTRLILTNNLQVICRDLLGSYHWGQPGLLSQMPIYYDNLLKPILRQCVSENELPWKPDKTHKLYVELRRLMQLALEEN